MKKMLTKLKMSLTNNIGLKFLAVLIALVLWLAIVNVNDPEKTITVSNIPISVTNESAITSRDMVYNVKSEQYLNITVSGKRAKSAGFYCHFKRFEINLSDCSF